nr:transcription factor Adf-1-like isoform X1 [Drosophila bipectinata]
MKIMAVQLSAREDKLKLISAIRARPIIWDLTHELHFNYTSLNNAWEAVAAELRKDVKDCKRAWKSLRACMRYHQKISRKKKPSGSAGGSVVPGPKASDDYDWDFASEMAFLSDLSEKRRHRTTTLPKPPEASTSSEISEDPLNFADDESQPSSSFDQSMLEEEELQQQKGIEDMEKESSSSYSYKPSTKKHKTAAAESCVLTQIFTEYVDLQKAIVSQTTNVPSLVTYWAEIMKELPQKLKDEAEERVTKLLWDLRKRAKNYE